MEEGYVCLYKTDNPAFESFLINTGKSRCYKCREECENPVQVQPEIKNKMLESEIDLYLKFPPKKITVLSDLSATLSK